MKWILSIVFLILLSCEENYDFVCPKEKCYYIKNLQDKNWYQDSIKCWFSDCNGDTLICNIYDTINNIGRQPYNFGDTNCIIRTNKKFIFKNIYIIEFLSDNQISFKEDNKILIFKHF